MAIEHAQAYEACRVRISELVAEAVDVGTTVPACPDWSVKDLVAHVTGLVGDWLGGNISAYGSDEWTEHQVEVRRVRAAADVLAEWESYAAKFNEQLADPESHGVAAFMPRVVLVDLTAHEHDIRGALGARGARDSDAVLLSLGSQISGMRGPMGNAGLPPLEIEAIGHRSWMVGRGEPATKLRGELFELFRATGGRRTREQVAALDWSQDPEPYLDHWLQYPFAWPDTPLDE